MLQMCLKFVSVVSAMRFPDGFLWGAATAAHQIEGNNLHSDWWRSENEGRLPRSGDACDSWNRWADDVDLLEQIGLNAYRLSVEWARIEPEPGRFDQAAIDTYRRLFEALREAHIEPMVTLHHFTSPPGSRTEVAGPIPRSANAWLSTPTISQGIPAVSSSGGSPSTNPAFWA
jgi:beta-glucosidase/6-phospho-beta-glucosidase/beta-galactosidase